MANAAIDVMWDDSPVDVTAEANFIWSIANKLRGSYMPDKYGDVIIPMTIIRRFECALLDDETKRKDVIETFKQNPNYPEKALFKKSGFQFYNTSEYTLQELCNDADNVAANFKVYIAGYSANVRSVLKELEMEQHINKMDKDGCLYSVVKAFSELDLSSRTFDSIKMGYIFENLIGRFYQNVDAGQFYTGRDIIKLLVSLLISEGCDDIFDEGKIITVCDQACGTGGMLSTAYSYLKHYNPSADVRLFGQGYFFLDPADVEAFNKVLYESAHTSKDKKQMTFYLQKAKRVIDGFAEEKRTQAALDIRHFIRFYEFLLQASCFEDVELHKKYNFLSYLIAYIRINHGGGGYNLDGMIRASEFFQKRGEEHKKSDITASPVLKLPTAYDIVLTPAKEERLSQIIREINSRTGKQYDNDVAIKAALQIRDIMKKSEELKTSAKNNSEQDFEFAYFDHVDDALIDGLEQNQDFFTLLLQNDEIKREVLGLFLSDTYHSLRDGESERSGMIYQYGNPKLMMVAEKPVDYGKKDK